MGEIIFGVDHGYGRMKTANCNFISGYSSSDRELPYSTNVLQFANKWYQIGDCRLPYKPNKLSDDSYYILTIAALAQEMKYRSMHTAQVCLAAGAPLTRFGYESGPFRDYLQKNKEIAFRWEGESYHVKLTSVEMFPQGYSALAWYAMELHQEVEQESLLVDVGAGTMDVAYIRQLHPIVNRSYSVNMGVSKAYNMVNERLRQASGQDMEETMIDRIILGEHIRIPSGYKDLIETAMAEYAAQVKTKLMDLGYNLTVLPVYWIGGGASIIQKYADLDDEMNTFISDPRANAKGYELLCMGKKAKEQKTTEKERTKK